MNSIQEIQDAQYQNMIQEHTNTLKDYIIEVSQKAQQEGKPVSELIDEGILSGILGGVIGGAAGKSVMSAVCKALGIDERSTLGQLLTSRTVLTGVGAYLGYKW